MKDLLLLVCYCLAIPVACTASPEIYVSNATEFLDAIGNNRTVVLKQGEYDLSQLTSKSGDHYRFEQQDMKRELHLFDLVGFAMKGENGALPHILTAPRYGEVLCFDQCKDIHLGQLRIGHGSKKDNCTGGVLKFQNCEDVVVVGCILYGSGNQGLSINECKRFLSTDNVIEECVVRIMEIFDSQHIYFKACTFRNNETGNQVEVWTSTEINFKDCIFQNNWVPAYEKAGYFFEVEAGCSISISGGTFKENTCDHLGPSPQQVKVKKMAFGDGNSFRKGPWPSASTK